MKQTFVREPGRSGRVVYSTVLATQMVMVLIPFLNLHQCLWTHLQGYGSKRLSCHADLYTVSRRGESEEYAGEKAPKKGSTLSLKPRAGITTSPKTGVSVADEKDLCPIKTLKNFREIEFPSTTMSSCLGYDSNQLFL